MSPLEKVVWEANEAVDSAGYEVCFKTIELLSGASALYRASNRSKSRSVLVMSRDC